MVSMISPTTGVTPGLGGWASRARNWAFSADRAWRSWDGAQALLLLAQRAVLGGELAMGDEEPDAFWSQAQGWARPICRGWSMALSPARTPDRAE
jgi:hypothetical protein